MCVLRLPFINDWFYVSEAGVSEKIALAVKSKRIEKNYRSVIKKKNSMFSVIFIIINYYPSAAHLAEPLTCTYIFDFLATINIK